MALRTDTYRIDRIQTKAATFATNGTITFDRAQAFGTTHRHKPVKFVGEMTVALCAAEDAPDGSLERVEADGSAVVNILGAVPFNAGAATAGTGDLVANGTGGLKAATTAGAGLKKRVASVIGTTAWVLF